MKVGDLIKLHDSSRRNGILAGKVGLVVDLDKHNNQPVSDFWIFVGGAVKLLHLMQIEEVISESR